MYTAINIAKNAKKNNAKKHEHIKIQYLFGVHSHFWSVSFTQLNSEK